MIRITLSVIILHGLHPLFSFASAAFVEFSPTIGGRCYSGRSLLQLSSSSADDHASSKQQRRKPRFVQQLHKPQQKQQQPQKTVSKDFMWKTGKSIEELEASMSKRWGTDVSQWTEDPLDYEDDTKVSKPVVDPWEPKQRMDYYDEDDEGYEALDNDDQDESKEFYNVGKLLRPKPVAGGGSSYFFNPRAAQTAAVETSTPQTPTLNKPKTKARKAPTPLYDNQGNELYLTLEQARRTVEAITDEQNPAGSDDDNDSSLSWQELGITSQVLLDNLQSIQCRQPLNVQIQAIPSVVTGNDVLVGTATGSGKTLAFLVPLVQRLLTANNQSKGGVQVLIVAPGRELASQIVSVARALLENTSLGVALAIGGTPLARCVETIRTRKPAMVVGTPGRMAELVVGPPGTKSGRLKINVLQALVLDEFDALLEYKPHREPTAAIVAALQKRHGDSLQSILCSATASDMMNSPKVNQYLRPGYATALTDQSDVLVTSAPTRVSRTVLHGVVHAPRKQLALETIRRILHSEPIPQQVLIFASDARRVDLVVDKLAELGIVAAPLHGGAKAEKMDRAEVSKALREGYVGVVVATELAARGLDAPYLTHVINLDLPTDASHYAHRAGRCGRRGRPGVVINLTTSPQERNVPKKLCDQLGVELQTVDVRSGKLYLVDPETVEY